MSASVVDADLNANQPDGPKKKAITRCIAKVKGDVFELEPCGSNLPQIEPADDVFAELAVRSRGAPFENTATEPVDFPPVPLSIVQDDAERSTTLGQPIFRLPKDCGALFGQAPNSALESETVGTTFDASSSISTSRRGLSSSTTKHDPSTNLADKTGSIEPSGESTSLADESRHRATSASNARMIDSVVARPAVFERPTNNMDEITASSGSCCYTAPATVSYPTILSSRTSTPCQTGFNTVPNETPDTNASASSAIPGSSIMAEQLAASKANSASKRAETIRKQQRCNPRSTTVISKNSQSSKNVRGPTRISAPAGRSRADPRPLSEGSCFPPSSNSANGGQMFNAKLMDMGKKLLEAAREGKTDHVRQLVVGASAPFTSDWLGTTALHVAAQWGHFEIAEILLRGGINRDAKTKLERTALHVAAQSGSVEVVDLLLNNGSEVDSRDMLKMTPLHWAVERGHANVVKRLLLGGADICAKSKFLLTPVEIAQESGSYEMRGMFKNWTVNNDLQQIFNPTPNHQHQTVTVVQRSLVRSEASSSGGCVVNLGESTNNPVQTSNFNWGVDWATSSSCSSSLSGRPVGDCNLSNTCVEPDSCDNSFLKHTGLARDLSDETFGTEHGLSTPGGLVKDQTKHLTMAVQIHQRTSTPALDIGEPYIDLAELEWNALKLEPDYLLASASYEADDDEVPKVGNLMKIVEELQKENRQLRQRVEQLSTPSH